MAAMYKHIIREGDWKLIESFPEHFFEPFYLAGGTGLALQIGHRYSNDFDFFTDQNFNNESIKQILASVGTFQLFQDKEGTVEGSVNNTRLSFFHYPYPLIDETIFVGRLELASILDIALMKLSALSSRGSRKDFVDLYFLKDKLS